MLSLNLISQIINKIAPGVFRSFWVINDDSAVIGSHLKLSFKPIIDHFNLTGNFVLLHWQAKPKGLRRWGVYDSATDNYYGCDADKVGFGAGKLETVSLLQLDEKLVNTVPTAVVIFHNARAIIDGNYLFIEEN